jgi:hypothetical protein
MRKLQGNSGEVETEWDTLASGLCWSCVSILGENIDAIHRNAENFIDAIKGVGLEGNLEETKPMLVSREQIQIKIGT